MFTINGKQLAPKIGEIMTALGWGMPLLDWTKRSNQHAKSILENDNDVLFAPQNVIDDDMATAIRSLLYLWSGWPDFCNMWLPAAPDTVRPRIAGLAHRQQGHMEESKNEFQQITDQDNDQPLMDLAMSLISDNAESSLRKFRDIIELDHAWEPFTFTDVFEQARQGQLSHASEEVIRTLQWEEFNHLFQRCYLGATGVDITKSEQSVKPKIEPAWKKNQPARVRSARTPSHDLADSPHLSENRKKTNTPGETKPVASESSEVRLKCPKCKKTTTTDVSSRGSTIKCSGCGGSLRVGGGDSPDKSSTPSNVKHLKCPKCGNIGNYAESSRNKRVVCSKCRADFLFAA